MAPRFLTLDEGLAIHAHQIERHGGSPGIRDIGVLDSAMAMPQATFAGAHLHGSLHEMAAAYLFHMVQNHPFSDDKKRTGNKRAGLAAALAFLRLNGVRIRIDEDELVALVVGVAAGKVSKAAVAVMFEEHSMVSR